MTAPRLTARANGQRAIVLDAGELPLPAMEPQVGGDAAGDESKSPTMLVLGYRQTVKSAAAGGKANANGFRFAVDALPAIAASFAGQPFIAAHDWGDPRARGGTILEAYDEPLDGSADEEGGGAVAMYYRVELVAPWAREGVENGTIDRFSLGVVPEGEIMCTVHQAPVWSVDECWCFPGELVTVQVKNADGELEPTDLIAEWEYSAGRGVELSAVNVPAVEGTRIVEPPADADDPAVAAARPANMTPARFAALCELGALCGRKHRDLVAHEREHAAIRASATHPEGRPALAEYSEREMRLIAERDRALTHEEVAEAAARTPIAAAAPAPVDPPAPPDPPQIVASMLATTFGLASTSTPDEVLAHAKRLADGVTEFEVNATIEDLVRTAKLSYTEGQQLRAIAATHGGPAFRAAVELARAGAERRPELAPMIDGPRATLMSDVGAPRPDQHVTINPDGTQLASFDGPDAYEAHKDNPYLARFMKAGKITADDIRKHGPKGITIVPGLQALIDQSGK